MTEVEALVEIASAIKSLAVSVAGLGTVLWFFLLFKNMAGYDTRDEIKSIARAMHKRLENEEWEKEQEKYK